ncbi:MAG: TSUP family transporter [Pseudomonadota bacterium]
MTFSDVLAGLEPVVFAVLLASSFLGSFMTVALGIGGGALLLAIMATFLPPGALIPVHGVIQLGSNVFRAAVMIGHMHWPPLLAFAFGSVGGAVAGGALVVNLPPGLVLIGIGLFVIWSVLLRPPAWLAQIPLVNGAISSFLTMFFGATGVFVANFVKALGLPRQGHVATHAVFMTVQHGLKILVFGLLGFAYGPWIGFMLAMIAAGFLGTLAGRSVLNRMSDHGFKRALDIVLILIALRLIWQGIDALGVLQ